MRCVLRHLVIGLEHRQCTAAAQWVPARELEVFGIFACEGVADVRKRHAVKSMIVGQLYFDADNKVHLLPAQVVARSVGDVGLGGGKSAGVLVAAPVHPSSWVECLSRL